MAEYCLDCFNQINKTNYKEKDLWIDYEELVYVKGAENTSLV